jgi:hypothetical protein
MSRCVPLRALVILVAVLAVAPSAMADPLQDIARALQADGYRIVEVPRA